MKYDFNSITDRRNTNCVKWDNNPEMEDVIPMWIADMDFAIAPFIHEAVKKRAEHPIFGYTHVPESYYQAVINWFQSRRGWKIEREWINYIDGIVPAISVGIQAFCREGEKVALFNPAYNHFFSSIRNIGRDPVMLNLILDECGERATYRIDFEDMERKLSNPAVTLFILCSPHNPGGRIWTREELVKIGEICIRHGVTVISDEIHCELEMPGAPRFIPFASISPEFSDISVTFNSPSKSFNIAGLQISNIICSNSEKRKRLLEVLNTFEHCDVNPFGVAALQAAYTDEGAEWLNQLNNYIYENYLYMEKRLADEFPAVKAIALEGTYLAWLDCKAFIDKGISTEDLYRKLCNDFRVWINPGAMYGDGRFMRINLATPRTILAEGLNRAISGFKSFEI